ncbi:MAG: glycosyltransferase, partial [Acidaminococcaceae bacterium]|nr:glycosyltransferase [Acidaminococcaceae bacterium]
KIMFFKIRYLEALLLLKKVIKIFQPDIIHAHYATSYGLLGALVGFHSYIISVWGSDIFDFPNISLFHKNIIKYNFFKADIILSTSNVMAEEIQKYTSKGIKVTPFGVDINEFKPLNVDSIFKPNKIVIGTIKTLEEKYGIEYLIRAFSIVKKEIINCL